MSTSKREGRAAHDWESLGPTVENWRRHPRAGVHSLGCARRTGEVRRRARGAREEVSRCSGSAAATSRQASRPPALPRRSSSKGSVRRVHRGREILRHYELHVHRCGESARHHRRTAHGRLRQQDARPSRVGLDRRCRRRAEGHRPRPGPSGAWSEHEAPGQGLRERWALSDGAGAKRRDTTTITHKLAAGVFYFDNPNFRAREGDVVPFKDTTVTVTPRINFANDFSDDFVGRDSPQVATRILQGCVNTVPAPRRPGGTATVDHCGGVSVWSVASGGRMGAVFGEDATEVAPPATNCTQDCQAQNQVRGRAVVLGFPFPVPQASRLKPRLPS